MNEKPEDIIRRQDQMREAATREYWVAQLRLRIAEIDKLIDDAKKQGVDLSNPFKHG